MPDEPLFLYAGITTEACLHHYLELVTDDFDQPPVQIQVEVCCETMFQQAAINFFAEQLQQQVHDDMHVVASNFSEPVWSLDIFGVDAATFWEQNLPKVLAACFAACNDNNPLQEWRDTIEDWQRQEEILDEALSSAFPSDHHRLAEVRQNLAVEEVHDALAEDALTEELPSPKPKKPRKNKKSS